MQSISKSDFLRFFIIQSILFIIFAGLTQSVFFYDLNFSILQTIQSFRSDWLDYGLAPFILLGSPEVSISVLLIISFYLYYRKDYKRAYLILCGLLLLMAVEFVMKHVFPHERVPYEFRQGFPGVPGVGAATIETPYSFPSGHSLRSMFLLGICLHRLISSKLGHQIIATLILFGLQAFGMNYYGFHWFTDVAGGYWLAWIGLWAFKWLSGGQL